MDLPGPCFEPFWGQGLESLAWSIWVRLIHRKNACFHEKTNAEPRLTRIFEGSGPFRPHFYTKKNPPGRARTPHGLEAKPRPDKENPGPTPLPGKSSVLWKTGVDIKTPGKSPFLYRRNLVFAESMEKRRSMYEHFPLCGSAWAAIRGRLLKKKLSNTKSVFRKVYVVWLFRNAVLGVSDEISESL